MFDLSVYEVLKWVQLNDLKVVVEQNVSNILIALYVLSYISNRKPTFLVGFLLVELYGHLSIVSSLTNPQYYLGYAFVYTVTYWYIFKQYKMINALVGYVTLIILELIMSLDAILYAETETVIYNSYTYIIVFVHLYIILSLFKWRRIGRNMGLFARSLLCTFCPSYNYSLFWYNKVYQATSKDIR